MKKLIALSVLAVLVFYGSAFAEDKGSRSSAGAGDVSMDKTAIQDSMSQYIRAKTSSENNTYAIEGVGAKFDYIHSGVNEKDGLYVSCADFRAGDDVYDIDYYVEEKDGNFEVIKEVLHRKNGEEINKVLYQEGEKKGSGMMERKGSGMKEEKKGSGMTQEKKGSGY
jgi:hypothetical protein